VILVVGKNGQLARSFKKVLPSGTLFWGSESLPEIEPPILIEKLRSVNPSLIINTAAYTAVDKAESDKTAAFNLNSVLPEVLATYAKNSNIPLIHFSTDYVFNGEGELPWTEESSTSPLGEYGRTKLSGEKKVLESGANALTFRTSWIYSAYGSNFVKTILRLAIERESLKIVSDQIGSPTFSDDLAIQISGKIPKIQQDSKSLSGIYHIAGTGFVNWYEFAVEIVSEARKMGWNLKVKEILPISSAEYPTPAVRPKNSRLNQDKVSQKLGIHMPDWHTSLRECLKQIKSEL